MEIRLANNSDISGMIELLKQVGEVHHKIRPARQSGFRPQIGIRHSRLPPLDESPAHHADHAPVLAHLLPHTGQKVGVAVMEGIEFANNAGGFHRRSFLSV